MSGHPTQLSLGAFLPSTELGLDNFCPTGNELLLHTLLPWLQAPMPVSEFLIVLWGESGAGLSHLLQGACLEAQKQHKRVLYLPLSDKKLDVKHILSDLESIDLLCIDDLDQVIGDPTWEEGLFHCYNQMRAQHKQWLVAIHQPLLGLPFVLPDLKSRLQWGPAFSVQPLPEEEFLEILQTRAKACGLIIAPEVIAYLVSHAPRCMRSLMELLQQIDAKAWETKRNITIPFVREVLRQTLGTPVGDGDLA